MLAILNLRVLLPEDVSVIGYLLVLKPQVLPADIISSLAGYCLRWLTLLISGSEPSDSAARRCEFVW